MNSNLRKEVVLPLIIVAAVVIAIFAGLTTYRIVDGKDKCVYEIKEFDVGTKLNSDGEPMLDDEYIKDNDTYGYLLLQGDDLFIAPSDYDKDNHDKYKDSLKETNMSDDVVIKEYSSKWVVNDTAYKHEIKVEDLSNEELNKRLKSDGVYCYIWLQNNEIIKILSYGETIIYE